MSHIPRQPQCRRHSRTSQPGMPRKCTYSKDGSTACESGTRSLRVSGNRLGWKIRAGKVTLVWGSLCCHSINLRGGMIKDVIRCWTQICSLHIIFHTKSLSSHAACWRWLLPGWLRRIRLAKGLNMTLVRDFYIFPCKRKRKNIKKKIISSKSKFVFYGCKMFRWRQDYHSFQPCANSASLCGMFNSSVSPTGGEARITEGCSFRRKGYYWPIKVPEFIFSHRNPHNLVTLQDNATIFDFLRHKKMTFYFL
jgi:hypothetical protein